MIKNSHRENLVSVIIPAFNAADLISETIDSILNQTYENIEIIVIDDGSTDNTRQAVESYAGKVKYIYQANSGGCSSPRNNGYRHSKGDFLYFFDADDIMQPNNIEEKVTFLLQHPAAGMACSNYKNFRLINNEVKLLEDHFKSCTILTAKLTSTYDDFMLLPKELASSIILKENFTITGSMMFPRSVFEKVGGYDETLFSSEDFDIHYRVLLNYDCGVINTTGFLRRLHDNNMTLNPVKMYTNGILSAEKLITLESSPNNKRLLQQRIIVRLIGLARYYRGKDMMKSLSYSVQALQHYRGFSKKTASQLLRNVLAALLQRA